MLVGVIVIDKWGYVYRSTIKTIDAIEIEV